MELEGAKVIRMVGWWGMQVRRYGETYRVGGYYGMRFRWFVRWSVRCIGRHSAMMSHGAWKMTRYI